MSSMKMMYRRIGGAVLAVLACSTSARADLLGYWSANSPNSDFVIKNDQGNSVLDGELFGDATYGPDASGVTGMAGDYALEFVGADEDYAALPASEDVTYEEITITAWINGRANGNWAGIVQSRAAVPIGIGYNNGGRLSYTWNNNNPNSYNFSGGLGAAGSGLDIPVDEWTFVALTVTPDDATLFVGPKGGTLESAINAIPHLAQTTAEPWRLAEDNCCGTERNFGGFIDEVGIWDHALLPQELAQIFAGTANPSNFLERSGGLRQIQVAGNSLGAESFSGSLTDIVKGDPVQTQGLAQYWYQGTMGADAFQAAGEAGTDANPLLTSGPFASETTWWSGNQNTGVISDQPIPNYPAGLAGTRFEGSTNSDTYSVRLKGELFVQANGEYLLRDGIDDFTMVAIDQDGNGVLDDLDSISGVDVGTLFPGDSIGDVLILDNDWSNLDGSNQQEKNHGIADLTNVPAGGEWRQIEIWMAEGGGGDGGIVYMGSLDDPNIFDETVGAALSQEERDQFVIRPDQLRSVVSVVESANATAELRTNVEYVMQVSAAGNDQIVIPDNNGVYTTTLNVAGATVRVMADGDLVSGTTFTLFDVDNVAGIDSLTLLLDDASQWDLSSLSSGKITFGAASVGIQGDIDGDGEVAFADFLILSANFGTTGGKSAGDIDGDGSIGFSDFLILSANFGQSAAAVASVPEPSGVALLGLAGLLGGRLRRRRK